MNPGLEQHIGHLFLLGLGFLILSLISNTVSYFFKRKLEKNHKTNPGMHICTMSEQAVSAWSSNIADLTKVVKNFNGKLEKLDRINDNIVALVEKVDSNRKVFEGTNNAIMDLERLVRDRLKG